MASALNTMVRIARRREITGFLAFRQMIGRLKRDSRQTPARRQRRPAPAAFVRDLQYFGAAADVLALLTKPPSMLIPRNPGLPR